MRLSLPEKKNDLAVVWKVFPLSAHALTFSSLITIYPVISLVMFLYDKSVIKTDASAITTYVFNGLQILFGVTTSSSVLARWVPGVKLYHSGKNSPSIIPAVTKYLLLCWIAYIVILIVVYCVRSKDKYPILNTEWSQIGIAAGKSPQITITLLGFATIILIFYWFLRHSVASLIKVLESGGHGFEKLNYMQLKTGGGNHPLSKHEESSDPADEP